MLPSLPQSYRPALILGGIALLSVAACAGSTAATVAVTHPTMIEVAPESFLGGVPCAPSGASGLKRYVATAFDVNRLGGVGAGGDASDDGAGGAAEEFQLPSSLPTPCQTAVGFAFVLSERFYRVEIDGYDTDDLAPRASGARQMVTPAPTKQDPVTPLAVPRWHASCEATLAVDSTIVRATHCTTFEPANAAGNGSIRLDLSSLLGDLECGSGANQIDHFEVTASIAGDATPRTLTAPCTDGAAVITDVAAGSRVSAQVSAFSSSGTTALAGTTCDATAVAEATVDADCSALNQLGTLRVDLPAALAQLGVKCSADSVSSVSLLPDMADKPTLVLPPTCSLPFDQGFLPNAKGEETGITVTPLSPTGEELGKLICKGLVIPGQLVTTMCKSP